MKSVKTLSALIFLSGSLFFQSCKPHLDLDEANAGSANFTSYVAIGSTYSSGFMDGALSKEGQAISFPKLLSDRFRDVGGGVFTIPYLTGNKGIFPDPQQSNVFNTLPRLALKLIINCKGEEMLKPERIAVEGDDETRFDNMANRIYSPGNVYHHFGIPSMKTFHSVLPGYARDDLFSVDLFNPFYWRFASDLSSGRVIEDVMKASPTFFTLELGMSDVLNYGIEGGTGEENKTRKIDLTDPSLFRVGINSVLDSMATINAKGIIANIPDITTFPYFRRIKYNDMDIDQAKADALNATYAPQGLTFTAGKNPFVIKDDAGNIRKLKPTEFITLKTPVDSLKCADWGAFKPIEDLYILTEDEIALIKDYTAIYNSIIEEEAASKGIHVLDLKGLFAKIHAGTYISGIKITSEFVKGGVFSLDGLHPNQRGQAIIANECLSLINKKFGATLPLYNIASFQGSVFP